MTKPGEEDAQARVNIVASHLAPQLGIEKAIVELRTLFHEAGISTRLICLGGDQSDRDIAPDAILCGGPLRGLARLNVFRALTARKFEDPDSPTILVGLWAALPYLLFRRRRTTVLVWEHSLMRAQARRNPTLRVLMVGAAILYRRATAVVAVSAPLARDLTELLALHRIAVIPNVIPTLVGAAPATPGHDGRTRLFMAGRLSNIKNQGLAIRALAQIPNPDIDLIIAGDGDTRSHLESLARECGVEDRVVFLGHVSPSVVHRELSRAHLFVHTAVGETFGYVYFEAADAELPVVAVRNPVSDLLIPRYIPGRVSASDAESLARDIVSVLSTRPTMEEFAAARALRDADFGRDSIVARWRSALRIS